MDRVTDAGAVRVLAGEIQSASRKLPLVVVTGNLETHLPLVDLDELHEGVTGLADLYFVANAELTRQLAALLPENTGVFGGAVRVYRTDFHEDPSPKKSRLFNLSDSIHGQKRLPRILEEIWAAANAAGALKKIENRATAAKAKVVSIVGDSRVMVKLDSGDLATIQQELVMPDLPLDWAFSTGQKLEGTYDDQLKIFIPKQFATTTEALVEHFGLGSVTLGLVKSVERQSAVISVLPNLQFEVAKSEITGNPLDVISSYLDVGDVVSVRIYRHPEGKIRLRMDDIDDDEPVLPALPILTEGEPWLEEGRDLPWDNADPITEPMEIISLVAPEITGPENAEGQAAAPPQLTGPNLVAGAMQPKTAKQIEEIGLLKLSVQSLTTENRRLKDEITRVRSERLQSDQESLTLRDSGNALREENRRLKAEASEMRKQKRGQQANKSTPFSRRNRFATDAEWFTEELRRAWLSRYSPQERTDSYRFQESQFSYSREFLPSVSQDNLDEDEIRKVIRVVLDFVTGRNAVEHKHTFHELQDGFGGKQRTRDDGALCWRVHLENGQPQAKRFHYWQLPEGKLELGWVADHDADL